MSRDQSSLRGINGQRYSSTGARYGGPFRVNRDTIKAHDTPSVAALADGGFVVTWMSYDRNRSGGDIYGQRYLLTGARFGDPFLVNTYTANHQTIPSIAALTDGGFLVTWASAGQDGSGWGIYGQRYLSTGVRLGDSFRVNTYTTNDQETPSVAGLADGGFFVTWVADKSGSSSDIHGQRYGQLLTAFPLGGPDRPPAANATHDVISTFDHSMLNEGVPNEVLPFKCDGRILAFTGALGLKANGWDTPNCADHPGAYKDSAPHTEVWILPGINYVGTEDGQVLNYEGHPGIDYRAKFVDVFAAADGKIIYPKKIVGSQNASSTFHTLALIPDIDPSYRLYYLHLKTHPDATTGESVTFPGTPVPGCYRLNGTSFTPTELPLPANTRVKAGCLIAISGKAGTPAAHLHFEVQRIYPASAVRSTVGTYVQCWTETAVPVRDPTKICLPLDPYGWTGKQLDCAKTNPELAGDIYECLTGIQSENLWR